MSRESITALRRLYDDWSAGDLTAVPLLDEHVALIVRPGVPTEATDHENGERRSSR